MERIEWSDFEKVEIRVGRVVSAAPFPKARIPAYILHVDFGEAIGTRKSSARITAKYRPEELIGRLVVGVLNFPPKQIGPIRSECLITGFEDENGDVVLCVPDGAAPLGARLL